MKLMIADDQMSLHKFLDKLMDWASLGITDVLHVYNGEEAAAQAVIYQPDLLLIDIRMPVLDGIGALKQLQSLGNKPKCIILSAYDEFEYARDALRLQVSQYLLKPVEPQLLETAIQELVQEIQTETKIRITGLFEKAGRRLPLSSNELVLLRDGFQKLGIVQYAVWTLTGNMSEFSMKAKLPQTGEEIQLLSVENLPRGAENHLLGERNQPLGAENHLLGERNQPRGAENHLLSERNQQLGEKNQLLGETQLHFFESAQNGGTKLVFMGMKKAYSREVLRAFSESVLRKWKEDEPSGRFTIGISGIETDVGKLSEAITDSSQAAQLSFYFPNAVHVQDGSPSLDESVFQPILVMEQRLEEKIRKGLTPETVRDELTELFAWFRKERIQPDMVYQSSSRFLLIVAQGQYGSSSDYQALSMAALKSCRQIDELECLLHVKLAAMMGDDRSGAIKLEQIIRKIKEHVESRVDEDLSLQAVADRFHIDKYQLSRIFKQEFHVNYWAFVTRIRMEKAAHLLVETNWKNNSIAERTGFLDESHFSRTFKKYFGVTPKEYRSCRTAERQV